MWVNIYHSALPRLIEYHEKNKNIFSKELEISDTVDMLLEEILEQKKEDKIHIEIDKECQVLIDEIDDLVSNGVLGYENREDVIIEAIRHRLEEIEKYTKSENKQVKNVEQKL